MAAWVSQCRDRSGGGSPASPRRHWQPSRSPELRRNFGTATSSPAVNLRRCCFGRCRCITSSAIFGAMLAEVDVVLMGAGIPRTIPGVLDDLAAGRPAELRLDVDGATSEDHFATAFDPAAFCRGEVPELKRPCSKNRERRDQRRCSPASGKVKVLRFAMLCLDSSGGLLVTK